MGKKNEETFDWDPIAIANRVRAREMYLDNLFQPIWHGFADPCPIDWTVEGLIPNKSLCLLVAEPKEGKTCLATAIALAVATGTPFAGRQTQQGGVLWLAAEESVGERQHILRQSPMVDTSLPLYTCYERLPVDQEESIAAISNWISRTDARLVVVDPLQAAIESRSLRDGFGSRWALQPLRQLCRNGVSVLVLHHRKHARYGLARSRAAEHDQLSATASLIISMTTRKCVAELSEVQNGDPLRLITLEISGRGPLSNQTVWLSSQGPLMYESLDKLPEAKPSEESLSPMESQVVLAIGRQPKDSDQIMCELNSGNPGSIRNCITRLRRKGMVVVMSAESRRRTYCLTSKGLKALEDLRKAKMHDALDAHADSGSNSALGA